MPKPFMTYDQQIQKLRDKHLIVADEDSAKDILRQIGYFTLITGYKDLFKNPKTIGMELLFKIFSLCTDLIRTCGS